jgi:hypothetical protein
LVNALDDRQALPGAKEALDCVPVTSKEGDWGSA